ncbi:hypothetical protein [Bacillus sp. 1P06AnD]|uniref:hypothetical protein n=1 Tax=Bacillus sp. 1P06AnD TaxID=3132208 RepID=UPI0039A2B60D
MNRIKTLLAAVSILAVCALGACETPGQHNKSEKVNRVQPEEKIDTEEKSESGQSSPDKENSSTSNQLFMIIDQTQIEPPNHFYFSVKKAPEGYRLYNMAWKGKHPVSNTFDEAVENGRTGDNGFYFSGDRQFSGFFYDEKEKGDKGEVQFTFKNDQGKILIWKHAITLK